MDCPNCGAHVGRFELSQNCQKCGINLYYSQQEKLLSEDAKRCELEFASLRIFSAKLKTAFIGGKPQIARIVFTVVCIAMLLIPFADIKSELSLYNASLSFGGIGIYNAISNGALMTLLSYLKVEATHALALKSILLFVSIAAILLTAVVSLLCEILSFLNIRRSAKAICISSGLGFAFSLVSIVFSFVVAGADNAFTTLSVSTSAGAGGFCCAVAMACMFIINLVIIKRDIKPEYKEVDLQRIEMRKKVKAGLVSLDDLPLPVFESEEEKQARLELEAEDERLELKEAALGGAKNV